MFKSKTLRDSSGFGWDDVNQVVTASAEVWDAFLAVRICLLIS